MEDFNPSEILNVSEGDFLGSDMTAPEYFWRLAQSIITVLGGAGIFGIVTFLILAGAIKHTFKG